MSADTTEPTYLPRLVDAYLDELLMQLPGVMVVGPRAAGKTTTLGRRASTTVRLAAEAEAAAFVADPDAALRGLREPVLLDEWQEVPGVFGAAVRAINDDPRPARYLLTGSVRATVENAVYAGTGRIVRMPMHPMTVREKQGKAAGGATFFDRLAAGEELSVAAETPDLRGYVELALESGFPIAALRLDGAARAAALEAYIDDLLTHDVEQIEDLREKRRGYDRARLRTYFETYALNSAGVADDRTLYDAAGIDRETALGYEQLLSDLFVAEQVPAWTSNRLARLVHRPKRYVTDPALIAAALRTDANGVMRDGDLLGRILDTFVAAQLRPEAVVSTTRPRLYHVRTKQGRQEIDLLAELGGERVIGIEIKATASPGRGDASHLAWLQDRLGDRFVAGVVFHTGPRLYRLGERLVAAPISAIWG